ncbi:BatD family protein [Granulosicoccus antarcticus]|uniref:Protein BatD n=1 Tax=Granulosicoccus antarcticus IMCC3135 TaxID=1192854 RepID=A0A2Z2P3A9_9GAMM|nr:BatD family protein [Granulosicoccus antarcticus]ASJ74254.1 hypothetical protein IMCC3135_20885 [Granulosicoccus antarcticus IMCC3135]
MVRHLALLGCLLIWICTTTALLIPKAQAADVVPSITLTGSDEPVYLGDSVFIELEIVGIEEPLDINPLLQGADLLRETTGTRIAVMNEQVVDMKSRRMELVPRREGRVIFGPLSGSSIKGQVTSNAIVIEVLPPAQLDWQPTQDDLQIQLSLSLGDGEVLSQVYIGQHIIADIELRHKYPIADEQITLPDFNGFDVLEQYVERRTLDKQGDGESWRLTAWRYHLFPQHSGELSLAALTWKGTAIRSRTQRATFDKHSQFPTLQIRPATSSSDWWLPASQVSLSNTWSKDPRELTAGDEILRTITLTARDVLASHLPVVVPPESRALTTTLIGQTRSQQLSGNHTTATAVFEFRMTAQSPIPVFLDTVRVPWFSTVEAIPREVIIPARRINVGLPDRADLLASLALENNWLDAFLLRLEGNVTRLIPWHITLVLLSIAAALIWLLQLVHWYKRRRRYKQDVNSSVLPDL